MAPPRTHDVNLNQLRCFWMAAREGGVARAGERLGLSQPAVSIQIQKLGKALGEPLFSRQGRSLALTDLGRLVFQYADEIFTIGRELADAVRHRPADRPLRLTVGVNYGMPKLVVQHLLEPVLHLDRPVRFVVHDDRAERLIAAMLSDEIDLVLTDAPAPPSSRGRVFNHLLGETSVTIFAAPELWARYRPRYPRSLDGAPFLLPTEGTTLRSSLEDWFRRQGVRPRTVAEIGDTTVLREFGRAGAGVFAAPTLVKEEINRIYAVRAIGRPEGIRERFYAISVERRLKHPAVVAIQQGARQALFA